MKKTDIDIFYKLLTLAYVNNTRGDITEKELAPYLNYYIRLRWVKQGEYLIHAFETVDKIKLVVNGEYYLLRSSHWGRTNMLAIRAAPEFIGTTQFVGDQKEYTSNIIASKDSLVLEFDADYFRSHIAANGRAAMIIIENLAKLLHKNSAHADRLAFNTNVDNLMIYIYSRWLERDQETPVLVINEKNEFIASATSGSIRTLYRSLNALKKQGLIRVVDGCITANAAQIEEIRDICVSNGLF